MYTKHSFLPGNCLFYNKEQLFVVSNKNWIITKNKRLFMCHASFETNLEQLQKSLKLVTNYVLVK